MHSLTLRVGRESLVCKCRASRADDRLRLIQWLVDFNAGANLTFVLIDGTGATAYSESRVVQANEHGASYSCP